MRRLALALAAPRCQPAWRVLLGLLLVVITYLALVPDPPRGVSTGWDKSNHALAFAALAFASAYAYWPAPRRWPALIAALLAYGGVIELAQSYLPPRSGDWLDLLADGMGAVIGLSLVAALRRWTPTPD